MSPLTAEIVQKDGSHDLIFESEDEKTQKPGNDVGTIVHGDTEAHNNDTVQDILWELRAMGHRQLNRAPIRLSCTVWRSCMFTAFWAEALSVEADLVATIQLL